MQIKINAKGYEAARGELAISGGSEYFEYIFEYFVN